MHIANGVFLLVSIADDDGISAFTCKVFLTDVLLYNHALEIQ